MEKVRLIQENLKSIKVKKKSLIRMLGKKGLEFEVADRVFLKIYL